MKIGLIDVDGHHFPNLALMRLSAYHKAKGDTVEWWWSDFIHYDIVYMSKIFSATYSAAVQEPMNADKVVKGGTGYCIRYLCGRETFDQKKNVTLPPEVERCRPDYSFYPQFDFAVSMTSRGCPRGCGFCHVGAKEGYCSVKVADVGDFWDGQPEIKVLDPNLTACADKRDLMAQYRETGAVIDFTQGLDIRLLDEADIDDLNRMRLKQLHFAWDKPGEQLEPHFRWYAALARRKPHGSYASVYVLTNFGSSLAEDLNRIYTLRDMGYDPYVMIYNKPNAPRETRLLQRWCNNKVIFKTVRRFEDYDCRRG